MTSARRLVLPQTEALPQQLKHADPLPDGGIAPVELADGGGGIVDLMLTKKLLSRVVPSAGALSSS